MQAADDQTYGEAYPYTPFPAENDNDKAKEYLDAAMKEMGVSNPADIKITLFYNDNTDGAKKQAEVLQEHISEEPWYYSRNQPGNLQTETSDGN